MVKMKMVSQPLITNEAEILYVQDLI